MYMRFYKQCCHGWVAGDNLYLAGVDKYDVFYCEKMFYYVKIATITSILIKIFQYIKLQTKLE